MINAIIGFFVEHFMETVLVILVGTMIEQLIKQAGADRADMIRDTVVAAMYWAEQKFGVGTGPLKWEKAWRVIRETLENHNIKINEKEEKEIEVLMESYVPEINSMVYSAMPESEIIKREPRGKEYEEWIEYLRKKYTEESRGENGETK